MLPRRTMAEDLFRHQTLDGWSFDIELLFVAYRRGYRVVEIPIDWYYRAESKVSAVRDALRMINDIFRIRANARGGSVRCGLSPTWPLSADSGRTDSRYVAGLDEAGRGALAGPVAVGAVILPVAATLRRGSTRSRGRDDEPPSNHAIAPMPACGACAIPSR